MKHITVLIKKPYFFALILSLFIFAASHATANELRGQEIFLAECVGCHDIKPPAEGESIEVLLEKRAPTLRYAGSKFKSTFLLNWLQDPSPIRPLDYNSLIEKNPVSHMKLNSLDAEHVTSYLMTLRSAEVTVLKIKPEDNLKGRQIFSQRYSCYGCHQVRGDTTSGLTGGLSGPSLAQAGERLNPDWIYAFLSSPRSFKPNGPMPVYAGIISEEDLKELTKYIASFK
ncbi:MAG: cytochrome c [Thermodesulfobacteriota bacterium]